MQQSDEERTESQENTNQENKISRKLNMQNEQQWKMNQPDAQFQPWSMGRGFNSQEVETDQIGCGEESQFVGEEEEGEEEDEMQWSSLRRSTDEQLFGLIN